MFDLVIFDCDGVLIDSEIISANMLIAELAKLLRRCRTSIRADVKAGRLPAPIALGPRHRGWLRCDVMASLEGARCRLRPSIEGEEV